MMMMTVSHSIRLGALLVAVIFGASYVSSQNIHIYDICDESHSIVSVSAFSEPFIIRSPNCGSGNYYNSAICSLILQSGHTPVELSFTHRQFQLENSQWCRYDSLCIHGERFCGNQEAGRVFRFILPAYKRSTVRFQTNNVYTDYGFEILVTPGQCVTVDGPNPEPRDRFNPVLQYDANTNYNSKFVGERDIAFSTEMDLESREEMDLEYSMDSDRDSEMNGDVDSEIDSERDSDRENDMEGDREIDREGDREIDREGDREVEDGSIGWIGVQTSRKTGPYRDMCSHLPPPVDSTLSVTNPAINKSPVIDITPTTTTPTTTPTPTTTTTSIATDTPTTDTPTTDTSTTVTPTTVTPTTDTPTTDTPTTDTPTTDTPTTDTPATDTPTTDTPTTETPTTVTPTTDTPTTNTPTTDAPTTDTPTTDTPTTDTPTTDTPTTDTPTTDSPTTDTPTTDTPTTDTPTTDTPATDTPTTDTPTTDTPTIDTPATDSPTTDTPTTDSPTTDTPATDTPATDSPTTDTPTTDTPTTDSPTTDSPTTDTPATDTPAIDVVKTHQSTETPMESTLSCWEADEECTSTIPTTETPQNIPGTATSAPTEFPEIITVCDPSLPNIVFIDRTTANFTIHSPNFASGHYNNLISCSLVLQSSNYPVVVTMNYSIFDVELHPHCESDYLCMNGVKFCGGWLNGQSFQYIIPENSSFTVVFNSDATEVGRGFEIHVSQEHVTTQEIKQVTGGVGCNSGSVNYTQSSYKPGSTYKDGCAPLARANVIENSVTANNIVKPGTVTNTETRTPRSNLIPTESTYTAPKVTTPAASTEGPACVSSGLLAQVDSLIVRAIQNINNAV